MQRKQGFTLIELMITLAIIGILSAIAFPSYQQYVRRGIRAQGQQFLMDVAQRQEQYFLDQRAYASALGTGAGNLNVVIPIPVSDSYQAPTFLVSNAIGAPPTFRVTLVPIAGGMMAADGSLIINNLQQHWRETDGNNTQGANDCTWEDTRCTPS